MRKSVTVPSILLGFVLLMGCATAPSPVRSRDDASGKEPLPADSRWSVAMKTPIGEPFAYGDKVCAVGRDLHGGKKDGPENSEFSASLALAVVLTNGDVEKVQDLSRDMLRWPHKNGKTYDTLVCAVPPAGSPSPASERKTAALY